MRAVVAARLHIRGAIDAGTRINGGRPCRSDAESYTRRRAIDSEGRGITGQCVACLVGRDDSELNAALVPGAEIRLRDREVADLLLRRLTCRACRRSVIETIDAFHQLQRRRIHATPAVRERHLHVDVAGRCVREPLDLGRSAAEDSEIYCHPARQRWRLPVDEQLSPPPPGRRSRVPCIVCRQNREVDGGLTVRRLNSACVHRERVGPHQSSIDRCARDVGLTLDLQRRACDSRWLAGDRSRRPLGVVDDRRDCHHI